MLNLGANSRSLLGLTAAVLALGACTGMRARYHAVQTGDTLVSLAKRYDVPVASLRGANPRAVSVGLKAGTKVYIPFESGLDWDNQVESEFRSSDSPRKVASLSADVIPLSWPTKGRLSSAFGWRKHRMHEGIDIAAPTGTTVRAARSGHVIYAGNHISGYGRMVILRHADQYSSVYAHLSKIGVKKGQFVARGQKLGAVGRTGRSTGPHLHFEVRNNREPVDPLLYLQGQYAANRIQGR